MDEQLEPKRTRRTKAQIAFDNLMKNKADTDSFSIRLPAEETFSTDNMSISENEKENFKDKTVLHFHRKELFRDGKAIMMPCFMLSNTVELKEKGIVVLYGPESTYIAIMDKDSAAQLYGQGGQKIINDNHFNSFMLYQRLLDKERIDMEEESKTFELIEQEKDIQVRGLEYSCLYKII